MHLLVLTSLDELLLIMQTIFTFYKASYLFGKVNHTEPSLQLVFLVHSYPHPVQLNFFRSVLPISFSREVFLKGKAQYGWPPCTNKFRLVPFYFENIIHLCFKTCYLNEEVNCTEPSPHLLFPAFFYPSDKLQTCCRPWYWQTSHLLGGWSYLSQLLTDRFPLNIKNLKIQLKMPPSYNWTVIIIVYL